jgi:hypothetical protein
MFLACAWIKRTRIRSIQKRVDVSPEEDLAPQSPLSKEKPWLARILQDWEEVNYAIVQNRRFCAYRWNSGLNVRVSGADRL